MKTRLGVVAGTLVLLIGITLFLFQEEDALPDVGPAAGAPHGREAGPRAGAREGLAFSARVERVVDGDTLLLQGGERVRLLGIDAPERDDPLHAQARTVVRRLVEGRRVEIEAPPGRPRDSYGRTLALVHGDGVTVNEELVALGLARVYLKGDTEVPAGAIHRLVEAQNRAIEKRVGLWAAPGALETSGGEGLVATRFRYHRARCASLSGSASGGSRARPVPTTREAALRSGKSPCRTCKPRRRRASPISPRRSACNRPARESG